MSRSRWDRIVVNPAAEFPPVLTRAEVEELLRSEQVPPARSCDADPNLHVRRRNCDAPVEGSSALEPFDQPLSLVLTDARELEVEEYGREDGDVVSNRMLGIEPSGDVSSDGA